MAVLFSFAAVGALNLVSKPQTFAVIDARSEYVEFSVFNPELSIIYGSGLRVSSWSDDSEDGQCVEGALLPGVMSLVSYQRIAERELVVTISGKGERLNGGIATPFNGEVVLYTDAEECGALTTSRFPIWGPGKIGSSLTMRSDGPGPILLEGTLETFGRTVDLWPFGRGGAIYSAGEPLTIPSGGFVESDAENFDSLGKIPDEQTALFGYVSMSDEPGLSVQVTTETPRLQVSTPGVREDSSRIEVGLFAQVLNDPTILAGQLTLVLLVLLWPITIDLVGLAFSGSDQNGQLTDTIPEVLPQSIPSSMSSLKGPR
ncbi:hypothetical protein [Pseudorhizobium flavum]|uniref:hypothetical protein n=1 Tax=Pseudorhizobium flavum TaxID=1335061 RepID=UPI0037706120